MRSMRKGYSLIELLICIAIISILMALYLPVLSKARQKAERVANGESLRQEAIGRMADSVNSTSGSSTTSATPTRAACRAAFRKRISDGSGDGEMIVTEMRYEVRTEEEFAAYWHTLINPAATAPLEYTDSGELIAKDEAGHEFVLTAVKPGAVGLAWGFLSSNLAETSSGSLGTTVLYQDGHVAYVTYPSEFPACAAVAELSHRYMVESGVS